MLDLDAALKRYDVLMQKGRNALQCEINQRSKNNSKTPENVLSVENIWFQTDEFIADLEHFLNEALAPERSYIYGEDFTTTKKVEIKEF